MASNTKERSIHTVVVRYPNGDKEYWLTEEAFSVGDEIRGRNGRALVIEQVLEPAHSGTYRTITLADEAA
jgi:hypothetical protein